MSDAGRTGLGEISAALLLGGTDPGKADPEAVLRLAGLLEPLFGELLLVGDDPPDGAPGRPVPDLSGSPCALRGLVSALDAARGPRVLVLAAEQPAVTPELLLALVAFPEADAVVPRDADGRLQPLCGLYRRAPALRVARRRLSEGRLSLAGLLEELQCAVLEGEDLTLVDAAGQALRRHEAHGVSLP